MTAKPIKIEGHPLQMDPDGVLRSTKCYPEAGGDKVSTCIDSACLKDRATEAQTYLNTHNILIDRNGMPVSTTDLFALEDFLREARTDWNITSQKLQIAEATLKQAELRLAEAHAKILAEQEAKEAFEAEQLAKAQARILTQLENMSPERIAQLIAEAGVDRLGPVADSARQVLHEANLTLQASYWIRSKELQVETVMTAPWVPVEGLPKYKAVKNPSGGYWAVTGVCSVGALALAKATLNDIPVVGFSEMASGDRGLRIATEALAWAIRDTDNWRNVDLSVSASSYVVSWNDGANVTREDVLAVWNHAEQCPFLDLGDEDNLYVIGRDGYTNYQGAVFTSEAEAQSAINDLQACTAPSPYGDAYVQVNADSLTDPRVKAIAATNGKQWVKDEINGLIVQTMSLPEPMLARV